MGIIEYASYSQLKISTVKIFLASTSDEEINGVHVTLAQIEKHAHVS